MQYLLTAACVLAVLSVAAGIAWYLSRDWREARRLHRSLSQRRRETPAKLWW